MAGVTKSTNIDTSARITAFLSSFSQNWNALLNIMSTMRLIEKVPGQVMKYKKGTIVLENSVDEGETIPLSLAGVNEVSIGEPTLEKYAKGITAEAILEHGYDDAVALTDEAFINALQKKVTTSMYTFLKTGTLTATYTTWQMAMAMAKAHAEEMFDSLDLTASETVAFINRLDLYTYLGGASITIQTAFGLDYVENFMGYRIVFIADSARIPRGTVIATPISNVVAYYINPATTDLAKAELVYEVDGVTPLIGFAVEGKYGNATSVAYAIMGLYLFAEYLDGIAVVKAESSGVLATVTGTSGAGTEVGDSLIKVTSTASVAGSKFYFKAQASTAPSAPSYGEIPDLTGWTLYDGGTDGKDYTLTNGHKMTIIEINGVGQCVGASSAITVVSKTS